MITLQLKLFADLTRGGRHDLVCRQHPFLNLKESHHAAAVHQTNRNEFPDNYEIKLSLTVIFLKFHILCRGREFRLGLLVPNQLVQLQATHQQCCRVHLHNVCLDQSPLEINEWIMSFEGEDSHLHGGGHLHVLALVESLLRCSCILGVGSETLPCEHFYLN